MFSLFATRISKRITIIFRGTYAEDTNDWKRNLQFDRTEVELPDALRSSFEDNKNNNKNQYTINLHRGCYEYLFRNEDRDPSYTNERYDEILDVILQLVELYPDFKVFVTGHSLGGALGLLLSFHIAADPRIPKPVTCVSAGSLLVGDANFQRAFSSLEGRGWIRHLRITNEKDPVPCLPPFAWFKPVGMHLELLRDGGHTLSHPAGMTKSRQPPNTWGRLWETVQGANSFDEIIHPHMLHEYLRRLERERKILEKATLNGSYRDSRYMGDLECSL
jgi:pimeloyl-ACP methyl ester carboxylesterase